jgi:hypothetical protein
MKLVFAGFALQYFTGLYEYTKDVLDTYMIHQEKKDKFTSQLRDLNAVGGWMFLDSGAFGAWSKGKQIDIDQYVDFCLKHQDSVGAIANLDVIPGSWGVIPTPEQVEESARKGWENYQYMLSRGIEKEKLVHVFHQGERWYWLEKIVAECPYFGISPANDRTTQQKIQWLEQVMPYITDEDGMPRGRFHGFGVTSLDIMKRYPWWSCDSTSWLRPGGYGAIVVPKMLNGKPTYYETPSRVKISPHSPAVKVEGRHFTNMTLQEQKEILEFVSSEGFSFDELTENYVTRHKLTIRVLKRIMATIPEWPWAYRTRQPAFF